MVKSVAKACEDCIVETMETFTAVISGSRSAPQSKTSLCDVDKCGGVMSGAALRTTVVQSGAGSCFRSGLSGRCTISRTVSHLVLIFSVSTVFRSGGDSCLCSNFGYGGGVGVLSDGSVSSQGGGGFEGGGGFGGVRSGGFNTRWWWCDEDALVGPLGFASSSPLFGRWFDGSGRQRRNCWFLFHKLEGVLFGWCGGDGCFTPVSGGGR
ncbi:hypothetical protein QL285_068038 [Trifolium repens]|nr:hypothetical protein QL285_068038 [Trifolium repens]